MQDVRFPDPELKKWLVKLMGQGKYDTPVAVMYDCSSIGYNNDLLYRVGYGENRPDTEGGVVIIDLINNEIYAGYEIGDKVSIFYDAANVD